MHRVGAPSISPRKGDDGIPSPSLSNDSSFNATNISFSISEEVKPNLIEEVSRSESLNACHNASPQRGIQISLPKLGYEPKNDVISSTGLKRVTDDVLDWMVVMASQIGGCGSSNSDLRVNEIEFSELGDIIRDAQLQVREERRTGGKNEPSNTVSGTSQQHAKSHMTRSGEIRSGPVRSASLGSRSLPRFPTGATSPAFSRGRGLNKGSRYPNMGSREPNMGSSELATTGFSEEDVDKLWRGLKSTTNFLFSNLGQWFNDTVVNSETSELKGGSKRLKNSALFSSVPISTTSFNPKSSQRQSSALSVPLHPVENKLWSSEFILDNDRYSQTSSRQSVKRLNRKRRSNNEVIEKSNVPRLPPPPTPDDIIRPSRQALMSKSFKTEFWNEQPIERQPLTLPTSTLWQGLWHSVDAETKKVRLLRRRKELFGNGPSSRQSLNRIDVCGEFFFSSSISSSILRLFTFDMEGGMENSS